MKFMPCSDYLPYAYVMRKGNTLSMSFSLTALAAFGAASLTHSQTTNEQPRSLLSETRNMAVLNAQNLSDRQYTVATPTDSATQFRFKMKGYVFGLRMIKSNYVGYITDHDYTAYADIKTSGLGALLKKLEIWAVSKGTFSKDGLTPHFHVQQNQDKKNRRVEMAYDNEAKTIDVNIIPRLGSQGIPPASPEERFAADDTISAVLNIMMRGHGIDGEFCNGSVRVFDSKQHYALRMERDGTKARKFGGKTVETLKCKIYYEPINGFDPEDLPNSEEGATPVTAYFINRPDIGLYIPVRFSYKISSIKAVIKLTDWEFITPS